MNSFVHANMYPDKYWLFNPDLTRGVDYDFILKFCSRYEPIFIDNILVSYDDSESQDRITNSADLQSNLSIIRNSEIRIEVKRLCKEFASLKEAMRKSVQERDAILVSPYWRLTEPVRNFLVSKPKLKSALKKILKTVYRLVNR